MGLVLVGALAGMALAQGENLHTMLNDGECTVDSPCRNDLCCSDTGFCGCSDAYCGSRCISQCEPCKCGANKPCLNNLCCGENGECGCGEKHCGNGCISNCEGCPSATMGSHSGQATYYTKYVPNSCYGFDTKHIPNDLLLAAASSDVFGNKAACGTHYEITCKGAASGGSHPCKKNPTAKVVVVDLCPGCNKNSFDLSKEAFSKIADLDAGRIKIEFKRVSNIAEVV